MLSPVPVEAAAPVPDAFAARAWGSFACSPALAGTRETVEIATDGGTPERLEYKLRLTRRSFGAPDEHLWTNSRTCPAARATLERLQALRPPLFALPGFTPGSTEVLVDGISYRVTAPAADPLDRTKLTWTSNVGTSLAAWVDASLARLKRCWSKVELRVAG